MSAKYGLTEHADEGVPTVLSGARICKQITGCGSQSKCIIEFAIREQSRIRRDDRLAKLQHHTTFEFEPENAILRFTRRVRHFGGIISANHPAILAKRLESERFHEIIR